MKMHIKLLTVSIAASLACFSTTSALAGGHTEVEALRAQIEAMTKRLDQLEKQSANAEKKLPLQPKRKRKWLARAV